MCVWPYTSTLISTFYFQHVKEEDIYLWFAQITSNSEWKLLFAVCVFSVLREPDFDPTHLLRKLRSHVSSLASLKQGTIHSTLNWLHFRSFLRYPVQNRQHDRRFRAGRSRRTEQSTAPRSGLQPVPQPGQQRCLRSSHTCTGGRKQAGLRMAASRVTAAAKLPRAAPIQPLLLGSCFGTCDSESGINFPNLSQRPCQQTTLMLSITVGV